MTTDFPSALDWSLPDPSTVTTSGIEDDQLTAPSRTGRRFLSTTVPVSRWMRWSPKILTGLGETSIAAGALEQAAAQAENNTRQKNRRIASRPPNGC